MVLKRSNPKFNRESAPKDKRSIDDATKGVLKSHKRAHAPRKVNSKHKAL